MARLLRDLDYSGIEGAVYDQIITANPQALLDTEQAAQAEMKSYLAQRYKVDEVFSDTSVFDITLVYKAKKLVEYTESAFSALSDYQYGDRVVQGGVIYEANDDITAGAFDADEWTEICDDKTLFYVTLPESEYLSTTTYAVGDKVWYADKVYTCVVANTGVLPTESAYWGTGTDYYTTGVYPDDTNIWAQGDNRNQQIVVFLRDITLYHLYRTRINPRNIPDQVKEAYNGNSDNDSGGALGWLNKVAKGNVNADLPKIDPVQGLSIKYGSSGTYDSPSHNMMW